VRSSRNSRRPQWLLFKKRDDFAAPKTEADDLLDVPPEPSPAAGADRPPTTPGEAPASKAPVSGSTRRRRAAAKQPTEIEASSPQPSSASTSPQSDRDAPEALPIGSEWREIAAGLPGSRKAPLQSDAITLQLARLVASPPGGDEWLHEPKWDGYRILALIQAGKVSLWSRNRLEWTQKLPGIAASLRALNLRDAALDGELVAGQGAQKDFGLLQATLSGEKHGPLAYMLFDILHLDGVDLRGVALSARKGLLEEMLKAAPRPLSYSSHIVGRGEEVFSAATAQGLEGIVSKRADAPHVGGRSDDWRKSKEATSDEFAVVGFTPPKGARAGFGALLLARPDPVHGWRYTGRLGTGFSNSQLTELLQQLDHDTRTKPTVYVPPHDTDLRAARWIEPTVVVEAFYRGVGKEGLLRQPSLKTVRPGQTRRDLLDPDRADAQPALKQIEAAPDKAAPDKAAPDEMAPDQATSSKTRSAKSKPPMRGQRRKLPCGLEAGQTARTMPAAKTRPAVKCGSRILSAWCSPIAARPRATSPRTTSPSCHGCCPRSSTGPCPSSAAPRASRRPASSRSMPPPAFRSSTRCRSGRSRASTPTTW
jgi:bifunctional non-homologous end joining protein LigD